MGKLHVGEWLRRVGSDNMKGRLITLEGISGMGKTYFFQQLKEKYKNNPDIVFQDEITDGNHKGFSDTLFEILYSTKSRFFDIGNPKAETLLIAAKQSFDEANYIEPLLNDGKIVICDRGYDTICIVEGIMLSKKYNGSSKEYSNMIYSFLNNFNMIPNRTILLDGNIRESIKRAEERDRKEKDFNLYTKSEKSILTECAKLYREFSKIYKDRIIKINRDNVSENVFQDIMKVIEEEIKIRKEG